MLLSLENKATLKHDRYESWWVAINLGQGKNEPSNGHFGFTTQRTEAPPYEKEH